MGDVRCQIVNVSETNVHVIMRWYGYYIMVSPVRLAKKISPIFVELSQKVINRSAVFPLEILLEWTLSQTFRHLFWFLWRVAPTTKATAILTTKNGSCTNKKYKKHYPVFQNWTSQTNFQGLKGYKTSNVWLKALLRKYQINFLSDVDLILDLFNVF